MKDLRIFLMRANSTHYIVYNNPDICNTHVKSSILQGHDISFQ